MNPGFNLQRDFAQKLVAVGAISKSQFLALMTSIDVHEAKAEKDWGAERERDRAEWKARPWWRKLFTFDRKP